MEIQKSAVIAGNGGKALGVAYTTLTRANFRVVEKDAGEAEFSGPRLLGGRRIALNGARCVRIDVRGGELRLAADLQGLGGLFLLIAAGLVALGVALTIVMLLQEDAGASPVVLILPLGIWLALLPVLYWWTRRTVVQAYDTFFEDMLAAEKAP